MFYCVIKEKITENTNSDTNKTLTMETLSKNDKTLHYFKFYFLALVLWCNIMSRKQFLFLKKTNTTCLFFFIQLNVKG